VSDEPTNDIPDAGQLERLREIAEALRDAIGRLDDVHFDILREASAKTSTRRSAKCVARSRRPCISSTSEGRGSI
jgi:hypothetical protein